MAFALSPMLDVPSAHCTHSSPSFNHKCPTTTCTIAYRRHQANSLAATLPSARASSARQTWRAPRPCTCECPLQSPRRMDSVRIVTCTPAQIFALICAWNAMKHLCIVSVVTINDTLRCSAYHDHSVRLERTRLLLRLHTRHVLVGNS